MKPVATTSLLLALLLLAATLLSCGPEDRSSAGLYKRYCARCHGAQGEGNERLDRPNLDLRQSTLLDSGRDAVHRRIAEGYDDTMPAFGERLSPQEIEAMIDFIARFRADAPTTP